MPNGFPRTEAVRQVPWLSCFQKNICLVNLASFCRSTDTLDHEYWCDLGRRPMKNGELGSSILGCNGEVAI